MTRQELRVWATAHALAGSAVAAAVLELLDEKLVDPKLKEAITWVQSNPVPDGTPERSGTLKPFDGSTGTPASGRSSFRSESTGV